MDIDSFVYEIKQENFNKDIAEDVETRFDTNGYSKNDKRPLQLSKNLNFMDMSKEKLIGNIMTEFASLSSKMYAYRKLEMEDKKVS